MKLSCSDKLSSYHNLRVSNNSYGGVAEWLNAPVLKTGMGESPSWVRIPPPPPLNLIKTVHYDALCISFPKVY